MKKYILIEDATICNKNGEITIPKGTEIKANNYVDEDGGVKGKVIEGTHKGTEIVFNISELKEIKPHD